MPDAEPAASPRLECLFAPATVAVVGASNDTGKFGGKVARNVSQSKELDHWFVTASGNEVMGRPSFTSLRDLPKVPDVVLLAVPAADAIAHLRDAADIGVHAAVLYASGFAEAGPGGRDRDAELREVCAAGDIALLGPNCIGMANFAAGLFLTSADGMATSDEMGRDVASAGTCLITQSGSLGIAISSRYHGRFRYLVSTGNESVTTTATFVRHLLDTDPGIRTFALVMESVRQRDELASVARAVRAAGKRIVLLKIAGSSAAGKIAALHTGAVSGERAPLEAFCADNEILLVTTLREFNSVLGLLSDTSYAGGGRLGVFTTSGGSAVLSTGFAERVGLSLPQPSPATREGVAAALGMPADNVMNPLDTTGFKAFDPDCFGAGLRHFAADGGYDLVVVPLGGAAGRIADVRLEVVERIAAEVECPIVPVWQHQRLVEEPAFDRLYRSRFPLFTEVEAPIEAMALISARSAPARAVTETDPHVPREHDGGATASHPLHDVLSGLAASGVPVALFSLITDADVMSHSDAGRLLDELGTPIAMKVSHVDLLHKSDAGFVQYPISTVDGVLETVAGFRTGLRAHGLAGATIVAQAGVPAGVELLCGYARDPEMGPYAVLGAGGIYTELLQDSVAVLLDGPDLDRRVEESLSRLRVWPILSGARGRTPFDWRAAVAVIAQLSRHFLTATDVSAMEINPLIVLPEGGGAVVVDARVVV